MGGRFLRILSERRQASSFPGILTKVGFSFFPHRGWDDAGFEASLAPALPSTGQVRRPPPAVPSTADSQPPSAEGSRL